MISYFFCNQVILLQLKKILNLRVHLFRVPDGEHLGGDVGGERPVRLIMLRVVRYYILPISCGVDQLG